MRKLSRSLTGALSEILILLLLKHKPSYGYELIKKLEKVTEKKIIRQPGSIYPLMNKMEKKGWIKSEWDVITERPRRIYSILDEGLHELELQNEEWCFVSTTIGKLNGKVIC